MDRRRFLLTSLAGALTVPRTAEAQPAKRPPRIGFLGAACPVGTGPDVGFVRGLKDLGYGIGDNIVVECRVSEGTAARYGEVIVGLTRLSVDLIVAIGSGAVRAAKEVDVRMPIVALDLESDPVASGWAASLARPRGNVTGIFLDLPELNTKQFQFLKEIVPALSSVTVLSDGAMDPTPLKATETIARSFGMRVHVVNVRGAQGVDEAVRTATKIGSGGALFLIPSPIMDRDEVRAQIARLALMNRVPTVAPFAGFATAGSLISYGPDLGAAFQDLPFFVDRIVKGTPPGDLPIQRPSRFHLVINLKTAKALGLTIPPSLLARADQVIE
jgi:putative tryptophan/tyrosine transport system substrate-binding protein